jgi:hypothetical protein
MSGPDGLEPSPLGDHGGIRIRRVQEGWEVATQGFVPVELEVTRADCDRLKQYCDKRAINPTRNAIELGTVCSELEISPLSVACPLARLKGTFTWPESLGESVTITVQVETWNSVILPQAELEELRRFLRELRQ